MTTEQLATELEPVVRAAMQGEHDAADPIRGIARTIAEFILNAGYGPAEETR